VPTAITSTFDPFPTCIVTSFFASFRLFCSTCFELQIGATEPVSNTQALLRLLVRYTSITCISDIPFFLMLPFFKSPSTLSNSASSDLLPCSKSIQYQAWVQPWSSSSARQISYHPS